MTAEISQSSYTFLWPMPWLVRWSNGTSFIQQFKFLTPKNTVFPHKLDSKEVIVLSLDTIAALPVLASTATLQCWVRHCRPA